MCPHAVQRVVRPIVLVLSFLAPLHAIGASAQTIGTFTWQAAPYCNVMVFTVSADGAGFRLSGFDDQCGATTRAAAAGMATPNPDGTYALSFYVVTANGLASHTRATLSPATISGPWTDNAGFSGNLAFAVPSPASGSPRPMPLLSSFALAPNAVDSTRIADGTVSTVDLANDSVNGAKLVLPLSRTITSASSAVAITNAGSGAALFGSNAGTGQGALVAVTNPANNQPSLGVSHDGIGRGIDVTLSNPLGGARAISVTHSGVGPGVFATSAGHGVWGITSSISSAGVIGDNTFGEAVVGRSDGGLGVGAVVGRNDGAGYGVRGFNTENGIGVLGEAGIGGGTGAAGKFENKNASNATDVLQIVSNGTGDLIQATQSGNVRFRVTNTGAVQGDGAYTSPAADVAEFVDSVDSLAPGDVVEIDADRTGRFGLATRASSTAVAGVITTRPGVLLNATDERSDVSQGPALALAGRVPVKDSAENGAIAPGDLLVSSSTPGHAMKAPAAPGAGTVVGKALGVLASGTGVIEMLVMLR